MGDLLGASSKPWVTFTPNWHKILLHENITITCNEESNKQTNGKYDWYKNNVTMNENERSILIKSIKMENAGEYECQTGDGEKSDRVQLQVSPSWVILQVPPSVYEGDAINLRCQPYSENYFKVQSVTFYKDGHVIKHSQKNPELHFDRVSLKDTGKYKCEITLFRYKAYTYSDDAFISVKELFPQVDVSISPMTEGDPMVMKCDTNLTPPRRSTSLQFAFLKDGKKIQEFSSYNIYEVLSVQLGDSGNYTCLLRTTPDSPWKTSNIVTIHIEVGRIPKIKNIHVIWTSVFLMLLIMSVILLLLYRRKLPCFTNNNQRPRTDTELSELQTFGCRETSNRTEKTGGFTGEDDVVYTHISFIRNQEVSSAATSYDVTYAAVRTTVNY
ncbi:high affinity immunoglobulin gamma Fc receptor I-like isoform X2 [Rhinoderma darwinii]|uniref:high affinity immunoglobulin gamma Fc receptor I-like isoform X2 n=1 Tax=Rhinoderma darwinii TaxID=43563 RepID=UPI003F66CD86